MAALRSDDILLDRDAVARALKAPRAPRFASGRPGYSLEDRLPRPGPVGSVMPPTKRQLDAMTASYPVARSSGSAVVLGIMLVALVALIALAGRVIYRATPRDAPATATASE